jgi:hypothetical protein
MRAPLLTLVVILSLGCNQPPAPAAAAEPAAAPTAAAPPPATPVAAPAAPPSERVDTDSYSLSLRPAGPYAANQLGNFVVALEPKGHWHINQEYPTTIKVKGPAGLELPKAELGKPDAAQFGDTLAKFDVPFTPKAAGPATVECEVSFAMCTAETCVPDTRTLALALPVN